MTAGVLPGGPVFARYRQSDGEDTAVSLAWPLPAAGVAVRQGQTDLPPGDTERRFDEALEGALPGRRAGGHARDRQDRCVSHQRGAPAAGALAEGRGLLVAVARTETKTTVKKR